MASLRKKPNSSKWIACFLDANGAKKQASTGLEASRENKSEAQRIADDFELAAQKKKTETQIRSVLSGICKSVNGTALTDYTLDAWLTTWIERVKPEVELNTFTKYADVARRVRTFGKEMAALPLDRIEQADVLAFRAKLHANASAGTTNHTIKVLRMVFTAAGPLVLHNPAKNVRPVKPNKEVETGEAKKPFTPEQITELMKVADDEDRGFIMAGLYSGGQRLGDVATLTAGQIDLAAGVVSFVGDDATQKTDGSVKTPILPDWRRDLEKRVNGLAPCEPLFPRAAKRWYDAGERPCRVSNAFRALLAKIDLAPKPNRTRPGAIDGRRRTLPYSFHSLRHTIASWGSNNGASKEHMMDIQGHETVAISQQYTHVALKAKLKALELAAGGLKLSTIGAKKEPKLKLLKGGRAA